MSNAQKGTLILCLFIIGAMGIYPPWQTGFGDEYGSLFSPPSGASRIDFVRLGVQCLVVLVFGGALWLADSTNNDEKTDSKKDKP